MKFDIAGSYFIQIACVDKNVFVMLRWFDLKRINLTVLQTVFFRLDIYFLYILFGWQLPVLSSLTLTFVPPHRDAPEATGDEPDDADFDMPKVYEAVSSPM